MIQRNVYSQAHATLQIVRLAILNEEDNHQTGNKEGDRLKDLEMQSHVDIHDLAQDNQERGDEEGDLQAAADGTTDGQVHLVLADDHDGRDVLRRIVYRRCLNNIEI